MYAQRAHNIIYLIAAVTHLQRTYINILLLFHIHHIYMDTATDV